MPPTLLLLFALSFGQPADSRDVLVVVNKDESTASVISVESGSTLVTLPTGAGPHETAVWSSGRITGTHPTAQEVSHMVVVGADGRRAFTANIRSGSISAVNRVAGSPRYCRCRARPRRSGCPPMRSRFGSGATIRGR